MEGETSSLIGRIEEALRGNCPDRYCVGIALCETCKARRLLRDCLAVLVRAQELEILANEKANIALRLLNENSLLKNQIDLIDPLQQHLLRSEEREQALKADSEKIVDELDAMEAEGYCYCGRPKREHAFYNDRIYDAQGYNCPGGTTGEYRHDAVRTKNELRRKKVVHFQQRIDALTADNKEPA